MANSYDNFKTVDSYILNDVGKVTNDISKMTKYSFYTSFQAKDLPTECVGWTKSVHIGKEDIAKLQAELYDEYCKIHTILKK